MTRYINMIVQDMNENGVDKRTIDTIEELKELNSNPNLNEKNVIELMSEIVPLITKSSDVNYKYSGPIACGHYTFPALCTLLHIAARFNCDRIASFLIERGAKVNSQDAMLCTPLHYAAICGNVEVAKVLIDKKADVNANSHWGTTPLRYALEKDYLKVAELLISEGANPSCVPAYINKRSQEKGIAPACIASGISAIVTQQVLFYNTELSKYAIIGATIASMVLTGGIAFGFAYMWKKHALSSMLTEVKHDNPILPQPTK